VNWKVVAIGTALAEVVFGNKDEPTTKNNDIMAFVLL
jgi:hypothetical protein